MKNNKVKKIIIVITIAVIVALILLISFFKNGNYDEIEKKSEVQTDQNNEAPDVTNNTATVRDSKETILSEKIMDNLNNSFTPEEMLIEVFKNDFKDFSNYISLLEDIISKYDSPEYSDLMQEIFEIISNDLDTAEKITDAINKEDIENLKIEEARIKLDRLGFFMITSPYVMSRLYSNLTPNIQAAINTNWNSEAIVEPVILKNVYEIEGGKSNEYEFKSKSPNNRYFKIVMEIVNKDSELYKKQGNYVLYMYSNKEAKQAEIEYVFCVEENDNINQSPLAGSFDLMGYTNLKKK